MKSLPVRERAPVRESAPVRDGFPWSFLRGGFAVCHDLLRTVGLDARVEPCTFGLAPASEP